MSIDEVQSVVIPGGARTNEFESNVDGGHECSEDARTARPSANVWRTVLSRLGFGQAGLGQAGFRQAGFRRKCLVVGHLIALGAGVGWLLTDPVAVETCQIAFRVDAVVDPIETWRASVLNTGLTRTLAFVTLAIASVGLMATESLRLLPLRRSRPTIRSLLFLTAMVGLWSGLLVSYETIAWQGKRFRSAGRIEALDSLAMRLHADWPSEDGDLEGLGPFMAYPFGEPRVLLLLTPYPLDGTDTVIAAIERSAEGTLRFQLGGFDGGDWIEWHGSRSQPQSFIGGLEERYDVTQYVPLRENWYLVRYDESGI